jgi:hypothetical protein
MTEVEIFKQSLDVSRIAMIITLIMTIITVTFSALSLAFQRSHNIKSIKPLCSFSYINTADQLKVIIKNAGLGPMIIVSVLIVHDNVEYDFNKYFEELIDDSLQMLPSIRLKTNSIIPTNEERTLIEIIPTSKSSSKYRELCDKLQNDLLVINYTDLYDRKYKTTEKIL